MQQTDEEIASQSQRARLRIGHIAEFRNHRFNPFARILIEQSGTIYHAAYSFLGNARKASDIVDRGLAVLHHYALHKDRT